MGSVFVIVIKKWKLYYKEVDFICFGFDLCNMNIVVVKIGYFVLELYDMCKGWIMVFILGGVD